MNTEPDWPKAGVELKLDDEILESPNVGVLKDPKTGVLEVPNDPLNPNTGPLNYLKKINSFP